MLGPKRREWVRRSPAPDPTSSSNFKIESLTTTVSFDALVELSNDASKDSERHRIHYQMVARSHFGTNLESKVFTMSTEEENYRTKLRRIDSPDISTAVPVLAPSFIRPASGVFTFTATKDEQSHPNPLLTGSRERNSIMRCRACNRPRVTRASSATRKPRPLIRDDNTDQVKSLSNFKISEPSGFSVGSSVNAKFIDQYIPAAAESTAMACPNLFSKSSVPPDDPNHPANKLEDTDQIVKKASEMVKLLESHIAELQLSAQAFKTPSERMTAMQTSPTKSYSNFNNEEPVNPFKHPFKHKLMETSPPLLPPLYQPSRPANSCFQENPGLLNFSPATTFPCQTPSPTPSLSFTPSQPQSPSFTCPCQTPSLAPILSYTPSQRQSPAWTLSCTPSQQVTPAPGQILEPRPMQRPSKKTGTKPSLNVKNIMQRLESLSVSPSCYDQSPNPAPKRLNEFTFPPLQFQSKLDEGSKYRTRTKAGSVVSSSSGINRHLKQLITPGQTRTSALTRKARHLSSKLTRSQRLPPRQQFSSDYDDDSGSSASSTATSSSWTTTQQSGSGTEATDANTYSSEAESSRTPESEYSTAATSSSTTTPINRPRLSISLARSFNRHRSKKKPSASNEKPISRLRRIKNKFGLIFHHHHHHHHHHHDDEDEKHKPSGNKLQVVRPSHEAAAVKRRSQQGHFRALLNGLMRHVRSNKKKKKSKPLNEIRRLKKKVQLGKVGKRRKGLKLPKIGKKSKFKAVRK